MIAGLTGAFLNCINAADAHEKLSNDIAILIKELLYRFHQYRFNDVQTMNCSVTK